MDRKMFEFLARLNLTRFIYLPKPRAFYKTLREKSVRLSLFPPCLSFTLGFISLGVEAIASDQILIFARHSVRTRLGELISPMFRRVCFLSPQTARSMQIYNDRTRLIVRRMDGDFTRRVILPLKVAPEATTARYR